MEHSVRRVRIRRRVEGVFVSDAEQMRPEGVFVSDASNVSNPDQSWWGEWIESMIESGRRVGASRADPGVSRANQN